MAPELEVRHTVTCAEVEPLLRGARAEVAMSTLQLRSALHEAVELEQALVENEPPEAGDALRTTLDELVQARRRELDRELDDARVQAARLIEAARAEAAAVVAGIAEHDGEAARRSREDASVAVGLEGGGRLGDEPAHTQDAAEVQVDGGGVDNATMPHRRLQVVAAEADEPDRLADAPTTTAAPPEADPAPEAPPEADPAPEAPEPAAAVGVAVPVATPDMVMQLVQGAVAAAVAQVVSMRESAGVGAVLGPVPQRLAAPRRPFWRALLHVDVFLPLLAALIVFVVLAAWVG